jgi:hypothetical protein
MAIPSTETIAQEYRTMTARQLASKYGVSHAHMRAYLSKHGITDPKRQVTANRRDLIRKLYRRGSKEEIAEYLSVPLYLVRADLCRMGLCPRQLKFTF